MTELLLSTTTFFSGLPMRYLITGGTGQLAVELQRLWGTSAVAVDRRQLDLATPEAWEPVLERYAPDVVINAGAYTQVDRAEAEPETCFRVNAEGVRQLALACEQRGAKLVQISSDYVFAGTSRRRPLTESEPVSPLGVYASSKYGGELAAALCREHLIVRTCGLYGHAPGANNFVATMLRLGSTRRQLRVVNDQTCTPTSTKHLARALQHLIDSDQRGLFHVTNRGDTTWHAFAVEIFRQAQLEVEVLPITTEEYGAAAPRPAYSVLDTTKYHATSGPEMPSWQAALAEYLSEYAATG